VEVAIAEQPVDRLDLVFDMSRAASMAPKVGQRELAAKEQRLNRLHQGCGATAMSDHGEIREPA
jgi:hypothetical protein